MRNQNHSDQADPKLVPEFSVALRDAEMYKHLQPRRQECDDRQVVEPGAGLARDGLVERRDPFPSKAPPRVGTVEPPE